MLRTLLLSASLLLASPLACARADAPAPPAARADTTVSLTAPADLARHLAAYEEATFVLLEPAAGRRVRVRPERARERVSPASTFKLPHALFALDAGAVAPDEVLRYDPARDPAEGWWPEAWAQDQSLASAVEVSAVWAFQELARRLGPEREQAYLDAVGYGNRDLSSGLTTFWLGGSLGVSADEQVDFLRALWEGALPVSGEAQAQVRALVPVLREGGGRRLLGKTGTARGGGGTLNWLVGTVERGGEAAHYALWVRADGWVPPQPRIELVEALLAELGWGP